jgi:hypothetical protein
MVFSLRATDVIKGHVFYGKKHKLLVVRIGLNGCLGDSKPCCMCVNLMKHFGIERIYYSNQQGEICWQKIDRWDEEDMYVSHGLSLMINYYGEWIRTQKLPLTKTQKTLLFQGGRSPP